MLEQRGCDSATAPRLAYSERADPAAAVVIGVSAENAGDLLSGARDEPDRDVGLRRFEPALLPLFETDRHIAPLVGERFVERAVERAGVLGPERRDRDAVRQLGRHRRRVELDLHAIEAARLAEPQSLEEPAGSPVSRE